MRRGGITLGIFLLIVELAGAILLYKWGSTFFPNYDEYIIFAGFAALEAVFILLGVIGMCSYGYLMCRMFVKSNWVIVFLATVQTGVIAYELESNQDAINAQCPTLAGTTLGSYCNMSTASFVYIFLVVVVVQYILYCYNYFVMWRFYVKLRTYPIQKGGNVNEQAFYEM